MASDRTAPKRYGFMEQAGEPTALIDCPTCSEPMAADLLHALHALDGGRFASAASLRWAEASHTVASANGGRRVALECNRCNRARGAADWTPDANVPTYAEGKRAQYREAVGRMLASRARLAELGYVDS